MEYILILIDRYVGYDKPQILAKLYLSYLNSTITWDELSIYAETIDRFLPGDIEVLCAMYLPQKDNQKRFPGSFARLISLGLLSEEIITHRTEDFTMTMFKKAIKQYQLTPFGKSLATILTENSP